MTSLRMMRMFLILEGAHHSRNNQLVISILGCWFLSTPEGYSSFLIFPWGFMTLGFHIWGGVNRTNASNSWWRWMPCTNHNNAERYFQRIDFWPKISPRRNGSVRIPGVANPTPCWLNKSGSWGSTGMIQKAGIQSLYPGKIPGTGLRSWW